MYTSFLNTAPFIQHILHTKYLMIHFVSSTWRQHNQLMQLPPPSKMVVLPHYFGFIKYLRKHEISVLFHPKGAQIHVNVLTFFKSRYFVIIWMWMKYVRVFFCLKRCILKSFHYPQRGYSIFSFWSTLCMWCLDSSLHKFISWTFIVSIPRNSSKSVTAKTLRKYH